MTIGYIVLARRPNSVEPVSAVFNGQDALEQAQNAKEYCEKQENRRLHWLVNNVSCYGDEIEPKADPVEYVIGEIRSTP